MYDLTGFQRDLLFVIAGEDEPHGLAIKEELEEYYEKEIHHGRLYPNLDTLVDKGLVEKGRRDRRTNFTRLLVAVGVNSRPGVSGNPSTSTSDYSHSSVTLADSNDRLPLSATSV